MYRTHRGNPNSGSPDLPVLSLLTAFLLINCVTLRAETARPNILWIVADDASPHIGCYGDTTIATPALDGLAAAGIRFTRAFVTCPVCSPCRSAMITGMYQTTFGAHHHRSQGDAGKSNGGPKYLSSYQQPVPAIPRLFKDSGYFTCNSATGLPGARPGKTDYNFVWNREDYDASDWAGRKAGQPFFAQVQLKGGKNRASDQHGASPDHVVLPPYYADHPALRADWAEYLDSWVATDRQVAAILSRLDAEGIADSTAVFFFTDHGISHLRGKQFLYDEGIQVPLIVRLPGKSTAGVVRSDLLTQIDVAASSLALAGIGRPPNLQGVDLFAGDLAPRDRVFSARDRCDETVDFIRCVRTDRFKYIRNFMPHLPHAQPNRYKDSKHCVQTMRHLYATGQLTELQGRPFAPQRPAEELYDVCNDPHELVNLAQDEGHTEALRGLRESLYNWMQTSGDLGVIPEPVLEELGREAGNKYRLMKTHAQKELVPEILAVLDAGNRGRLGLLISSLQHSSPAIRYWAAEGLGIHGDASHIRHLAPLVRDTYGGVRVAAVLARCRLGATPEDVELLANEINSDNFIVGMYAIRALEILGPDLATHQSVLIRSATKNPFEFTRRIAARLSVKLDRLPAR
ncbi:MAG: sulfatase-like hydrolase/transferase [Planctomycetaceae bacterium]